MFLDPLIAKTTTIVYTTLSIIFWMSNERQNSFYILGALGGIACASLYKIELLIEKRIAEIKNVSNNQASCAADYLSKLSVYTHVIVQQLGVSSFVAYLCACTFH